MCMCGCNEILTACNHVGCTRSAAMLKEMDQRVASGDSDDLILQSFVQEYGEAVLAEPPAHGFNGLAWAIPVMASLFGLGVVILVIRNWRHRRRTRGRFRPFHIAGPARARAASRPIGTPMTDVLSLIDIPGGPDALALVACIALTAAVLIFIFLIEPDASDSAPHRSHLDQLMERRDTIYENLRDLKFEYRTGKFAEQDYEQMKHTLETEAAMVLAEIETVTGNAGIVAAGGRRRCARRAACRRV